MIAFLRYMQTWNAVTHSLYTHAHALRLACHLSSPLLSHYVGNASPPSRLSPWIPERERYDIYVFATQVCLGSLFNNGWN